MRISRLSLVVAGLLATAACADKGAGPAKVPASIKLIRGANQQAVVSKAVNDSIKFKVLASDSSALSGVTVTFTVTAGGGTLASATAVTNALGEVRMPDWTLGAAEGSNTVTASVGSGLTATVSATGVVSFFNIEIVYLTTPTAAQQAAFESARFKWRQIIQSELTDISIDTNQPNQRCGNATYSGTVDDVVIFAELVPIDGPGKVLGSAGPCLVRQNQLGQVTFTIAGTMRFDTADLDTLQARGLLNSVILHEMGHVLGIGSYWFTKNLLDTATVAGDPIFTGQQSQGAFSSLGGNACGCRPVPVENTGGAGTRHSHWRENPSAAGKSDGLRNELMTGFLNSGVNPLSRITVNSLRDIGFIVDTTKADAYVVPPNVAVFSAGASSVDGPAAFRLNEVDPPDPLRAMDEAGHVTLLESPRSRRKQ